MEELRKYKENSYYDVEDITEQLIELSNLEISDELKDDLNNALYQLKDCARNKYNSDFFRTLYNVLLVIAGMEYI